MGGSVPVKHVDDLLFQSADVILKSMFIRIEKVCKILIFFGTDQLVLSDGFQILFHILEKTGQSEINVGQLFAVIILNRGNYIRSEGS